MSKEELIAYIEELRTKRAFSEEDQYLLEILDASPFTIWASDRDCRIKFWTGQCEYLYGYKKEYAIGKDFVDLFVAEDEKKAAREDQISIIDHGEIFHNIANDVAKTGNTLRLLTNCWRMKAPDSDEYWNVEMGLIIDFFNQEVDRLAEIVEESRIYKSRVTQFIDLTRQIQRQFQERKRRLTEAIQDCKHIAVNARKKTEFKDRVDPIRSRLRNLNDELTELVEKYIQLVQACGSSVRCEELSDEFRDYYQEKISDTLEDIATDFEEISLDYSDGGMVLGKDAVLKDTNVVFTKIYNRAYDLRNSISKKIDAYKAQVTARQGSAILQKYMELQERIDATMRVINTIQEEVYMSVGCIQAYQDTINIRNDMRRKYDDVEVSLNEIEQEFKNVRV